MSQENCHIVEANAFNFIEAYDSIGVPLSILFTYFFIA